MTAEKVPSWIERLLMPQLNEIKGELKSLHARIDALESNMNTRFESLESNMNTRFESVDTKIDSLRNELKGEVSGVQKEISSLRTEMSIKFDSLEKRIPVIEEITALKLRIAEIEKKLEMA